MAPPLKYVAQISHVREVSLLGTANLAYWRDRLAADELTPARQDGRAQLLIVAAEMRFMGVQFRELSFSVLVDRVHEMPHTPALPPEERGRTDGGAYLVQALNSCRFFAFCERFFFSAPYFHGDVRVMTAPLASIRLVQGGKVLFAAEMADAATAPPREPSRVGDDGWQGPVFLPAGRRWKDTGGRWFFAQISGHTRTYSFDPSVDSLAIRPDHDRGIFQALRDSQFAASQWAIREDAMHRKSKTYRRGHGMA